jgi:hypothetical protein
MRLRETLDHWPLWAKCLAIATLMAPVMLWVLLTSGGGGSFPLVLAYGLGVSALGGFVLGGWKWLLVPLLAMAVELAFAIPATLLEPGGGETPVSVILEAPFWTGIPALVGAAIGVAARRLSDANPAAAGGRAG